MCPTAKLKRFATSGQLQKGWDFASTFLRLVPVLLWVANYNITKSGKVLHVTIIMSLLAFLTSKANCAALRGMHSILRESSVGESSVGESSVGSPVRTSRRASQPTTTASKQCLKSAHCYVDVRGCTVKPLDARWRQQPNTTERYPLKALS